MKCLSVTKTLLAVFLFSGIASATTTLRFSVTGTNRATGFSDQNGLVGVDGMKFGLVIDTAGNGFQPGSYDLFASDASGFLSVGSVATDDYYYVPGALPATSTLTATGVDPGGAGGITSIASAPNGTDGIIPGVTTGDPFAIIWFAVTPNANGTHYGLLPDASFLLPASGSVVDFTGPFTGASADPIKPANYQFGGAVIPEPSRVAFFALGLLGFLARRRR